ncbi:hypothetical protein Q31a_32440 [Aureliella helgolandensis]|uniref:Uncharacterized protein n=1 Tax=Aureliella helgolandensis TaxID=2527968 RepID=A0A518G8L3_9BACT|nr:hypothetical protein Q31a_32440 [Aureliella helgolandensis]
MRRLSFLAHRAVEIVTRRVSKDRWSPLQGDWGCYLHVKAQDAIKSTARHAAGYYFNSPLTDGFAASFLLSGQFLVAELPHFILPDAQAFLALLFVGIEVAFAPVNVAIPLKG